MVQQSQVTGQLEGDTSVWKKWWFWLIIVVVIIGAGIGIYFAIVNLNQTLDLQGALEKLDPISKKQTIALIGLSDTEGLKRAGVSDAEINLILDAIANAIETANFEIIEAYNITDEEIIMIVQSDLFKSAWERVDIEKANKALEDRVIQVLEEGQANVDVAVGGLFEECPAEKITDSTDSEAVCADGEEIQITGGEYCCVA